MARRLPGTFRLTRALAAAHSGGVVCLADAAYGQSYRLHAQRPAYSRSHDLILRSDGFFGLDGAATDAGVVVPEAAAALARVEITGPLETRAGYHGDCGGWSDGYDAIAERMTDALADADVLVVVDSPGGAVMGIVECAAAVQAAKVTYGRRVTVVCASGMITSAAYWLACAFADKGELYITAGSMAGSIGARSAHVSEAGALAQAGLEWTDFAYPAGKVALSPARALSDVGKARGERDVMAAFDAFQSAVSAARPALSRKAVIALDADMLTGAAAVAAGLADAVATLEDVEAWALSRAGETAMPDEKKDPDAEDMPPGEDDDEKKDDAKACAKCEEELPEEAKFCAQCGASVSAEEPDEEEEPKSEKEPKAPPSDASVAAVLGLRPGASTVAIKTAAHALRSEVDHVRKVLGSDSLGATRGALKALAEDAKQGVQAAKDLKKQKVTAEKRERLDLCISLAKANLPGFARGDLLKDIANEEGTAIIATVPAGIGAALPLADLRGFVASKLKSAAPSERSPFAPGEDAAKAGAKTAPITTKTTALAAQSGLSAESLAAAAAFLDSTIGAAS